MSRLKLSCALGNYAHTQDIQTQRVQPEGIELVNSELPIEAIAPRFATYLEFDVAEYSFGAYCAHLGSSKEPKMIALPVFTSRAFRHGNIYVNSGAGITSAKDLAGRRVGIPQWVQTAVIYVRGFLADDAGVALSDVPGFRLAWMNLDAPTAAISSSRTGLRLSGVLTARWERCC